jgi:hypothetical protein
MAPELDASQQGGSRKAASADPYHFVLQFDSSEIDSHVARRLTKVHEEEAMEAGRSIADRNYSVRIYR